MGKDNKIISISLLKKLSTKKQHLLKLKNIYLFSHSPGGQKSKSMSAESHPPQRLLGRIRPGCSSSWWLQRSLACGCVSPVSARVFTQPSSILPVGLPSGRSYMYVQRHVPLNFQNRMNYKPSRPCQGDPCFILCLPLVLCPGSIFLPRLGQQTQPQGPMLRDALQLPLVLPSYREWTWFPPSSSSLCVSSINKASLSDPLRSSVPSPGPLV